MPTAVSNGNMYKQKETLFLLSKIQNGNGVLTTTTPAAHAATTDSTSSIGGFAFANIDLIDYRASAIYREDMLLLHYVAALDFGKEQVGTICEGVLFITAPKFEVTGNIQDRTEVFLKLSLLRPNEGAGR
jgi:hypothetical protein